MANDAGDDWASRELIDIYCMRQDLGGPFLNTNNYGDRYIKDGDDVLEAFAELCRGHKQVVSGVKTLKITYDDSNRISEGRGLLAMAAIIEAGHFNDLLELVVIAYGDVSPQLQIAGQKLWNLLGSGRLNNLRSLSLYGGGFGGEGIEALFKSLQSSHATKLEVLRLYDCFKDEESAQRAAKALADTIASGHLSGLLTFNLNYNQLGAEGAKNLVGSFGFGHLNKLESLDLSRNKFGDAGAASLAEAFASGNLDSLRTLDLRYSGVSAKGVESLAKSFCSRRLMKLESLELLGNRFGATGAASLAAAFASGHLDSLQFLHLQSTSVGDEGIKALVKSFGSGHLANLESLELDQNDVGDAGAEYLANAFASGYLGNLQVLGLSGNGIGDEGAAALARSFHSGKCEKLHKLDLSKNTIRGEGLVALVEAFKSDRLSELKTVNLTDKGPVGSEKIEMAARALGTGSLGSLKSLFLFSLSDDLDKLSPEAKLAVFNAYQKNPYLVIHLFEGAGYRRDLKELETLRERNEERVARLRKLQDEEEVSGEHGKVFLCGNPGVGKTTLTTTLTKGRAKNTLSEGRATWRSTLMEGMCVSICGWRKRERPQEPEEPQEKREKDQEPTRGIEVSNLHSEGSCTGVRPVTLALWDMAGQHDYEVLHSAFLPDLNFAGGQTTFFVIVVNANNGRNSLKDAQEHLAYWLRFISSNSVQDMIAERKRRVYVVLNCFAGDRSGHEKETWTDFLEECERTFGKFLNLYEEPIIVDVMSESAVMPFKNLLLQKARETLEGRKMPKVCLAVQEYGREWAEKNQKYPVLKWGQFFPHMRQCIWEPQEESKKFSVLKWDPYFTNVEKHVWEEERLTAAVEYLHEAGHLILFKRQAGSQASGSEGVIDQSTTGAQESLVIMDPQWFCQNVVGNLLLPDHMLKAHEQALRVLKKAHSEKLPIDVFKKFIFRKSGVPLDKIDEVVVLLSRIGLCYQLPGRTDEIFIPALMEGDGEPGWSEEK